MTKHTFPEPKLRAAVERMQRGDTTLKMESVALGHSSNTPLREALRALIGREAYDELMRGKRPASFGQKVTAEDGSTVAFSRPLPNDSGLPLVESTRKSDGWAWRYANEHEPRPVTVSVKGEGSFTITDVGEKFLVLCSPEGVEYTEAGMYETAHLLRTNPAFPKGPPLRFVKWEESAARKRVARQLTTNEKEVERGLAAAAARKARKNQPAGALLEGAKVSPAEKPVTQPHEPVIAPSKHAGSKRGVKPAPRASKPAAKPARSKQSKRKSTTKRRR